MPTDTRIAEADRLRPVSVLALGAKTERLRRGGLRSLGDVMDDAADGFQQLRRLPAFGRRSLQLVEERLGAVLSCTGPEGEVDWNAFSQLCGLSPADASERPPLCDADRSISVSELNLGVRADRIVESALMTAGDLHDDRATGYARLKQVPRLGEAAVALVDRRLRTLDVCRTPDGSVDWSMFHAVCRGQPVGLFRDLPAQAPERPPAPCFSPAAKARPVEVLRLGPKAKFLRQAGLSTIEHLQREGVAARVSRLPGVGPGTAETIRTRLADLAASVDANGEPQWDAVAGSWGYPVTPNFSLPTGEIFVVSASEVIGCWIAAHDTDADRLILSERLIRSRDARLTLDELSQRLGVTRERVRQREKKLLDGLCDALLADDQSRSPVQFSSDFCSWWRRAAQLLSENPTLTWPAFVSGLERAWGVPAARLAEILPLALAVLTDGGQVVPPRTPIPARLLEPLSPGLLRRPIRAFPVGRAADDLEDAGCASFGALLLAAMENRLPQGRSGEIGARILQAVAQAVDKEGDLDARRLAAALDMPLIPAEPPASAGAFLETFDSAVEVSLGLGRSTNRAKDIWRVRTRHPAAIRPTLEEAGAQLGTWGPTVKREETLLLASLNEQLVEGELTGAGVIWRSEFLVFVAEAAVVRDEANGDFDSFIRLLSGRWGLSEPQLRNQTAGLWAVLSLYPNGRRTPLRRRRSPEVLAETAETQPGGLIVLRGFRRVH